jgi:hypothetical protein
MPRLSTFLRLLATLGCVAPAAGCAANPAADGTPPAAGPAVTPADIDRLTGAPWNGTLSYLDYTSKKQTTIKSSLAVTRLPARADAATAWEMRLGYSDEPEANSGETAVLARDGRAFREAEVMERTILPDGSVRVVTERDGEDDNRKARLRFVYLLGQTQSSIQKLVRFTPQEPFFERHIYRWSR